MNFILNSLTLPLGSQLSRDALRPSDRREDGFAQRYDQRTLAYDVIWKPAEKAVVLICPKLLNLAAPLRGATVRFDGTKRPIHRLRQFRRYDEVWFRFPAQPSQITVEMGDTQLTAGVSTVESYFDGRDVALCKSKDNPLEWIHDWAAHYAHHQQANGFLFFDNGSETYGLPEIESALQNAAPEARIAVVSAPFPFGLTTKAAPRHRSKFFQTAILNVARHRFLGRASAVAPVDVDELMVTPNGTVFDEARTSRLGYITLPGLWRYAKEGSEMPRHADHIWRFEPEKTCQEKPVIVPERFVGKGHWDVHGARSYRFNRLTRSSSSVMLHCERLSTGWKRERGKDSPDMIHCPIAQGLWPSYSA